MAWTFATHRAGVMLVARHHCDGAVNHGGTLLAVAAIVITLCVFFAAGAQAALPAAAADAMPSRWYEGTPPLAVQDLRLKGAQRHIELPTSAAKVKAATDAQRARSPTSVVLMPQSPALSPWPTSSEYPSRPKGLWVGPVFPSEAEPFQPVWMAVTNGMATQFTIRSAGAVGIRAQLLLPPGLVVGDVRVRGSESSAWSTLESVSLAVQSAGELWTPYTEGDTQTVEVFTSQRVDGVTVAVGDVMHLVQSLAPRSSLAKIGESGSCNVDLACTSSDTRLDTALAERARSIARMSFRSGGGSFLCTGTLLNSAAFPTPYFITANHCISTQAEATSLQLMWFYSATACRSNVASGQVTQAGGAALVFTNQMTDSTLLRLNSAPPANTVFSAWDAALVPNNESVISVSHPRGDVLKYATGRVNSLFGGSNGWIRLRGYPQDMYAVFFSRGIIEGGSSGSGLYTLNAAGSLVLRGVLSGTTLQNSAAGLTCTNLNENATYGRLEIFQPQIAPFLNNVPMPTDDHPNQPTPTATLLPLGGSVGARLERVGDIDVFRIEITQTGTLTVGSTGPNDLAGALLNADGSQFRYPAGDYVSNDDVNDPTVDNNFGMTTRITPGTYYLSVAHWDPAATTPAGYSVFAKFTTAIENYTSLWWNANESGWGININHQDNTLFATLFTYDTAGKAMWLVMSGGARQPDGSYVGELYRTTGPAFNAQPFTPIGAANVRRVGSMRLSFTGTTPATQTGSLTYDVDGVSVTKTITRQVVTALPSCQFLGFDRTQLQNFQDLWWNPSESGWGVNVTHGADTLFATLFTYEAGGEGMWLVMSNGAKQGTTFNYQGDLYRTTGPAFNAQPFTPIGAANITRVGTMRFEFANGNNGRLIYDVNGVSVTKQIQRQVFGDARTACEKP